MRLRRLFRHLFTTSLHAHRCFPTHALNAIEQEIRSSEARHGGEIRFAIEIALEGPTLWQNLSPRQRALDVFARLRVWDTARRNGVLIYLLLADRDVEIVADRGFDGLVTQAEWEGACLVMEAQLRAGRYKEGAIAGIHALSALIERHFPPEPREVNELPNRPVIL
ncbi:MAG TPA: TPM domain-containing protein [Steroidobacteraceae bacterium]|nr:TPM domain-containing protein [Steroidobacteraceae bacterium]